MWVRFKNFKQRLHYNLMLICANCASFLLSIMFFSFLLYHEVLPRFFESLVNLGSSFHCKSLLHLETKVV